MRRQPMSATPAAKTSHGSSTSRSAPVISAYPADQDRRLPAACPHHSVPGRTTGEAGMVIVCRRRSADDRRSGDHGGIRQTGRRAAMAATVLLVEDERKLRDLIRSYLERAGFTVL